MTIEMAHFRDHTVISRTAVGAVNPGQVIQLPDGRAGYQSGGNVRAAGQSLGITVEGIVVVQKTTSMVILDGGDVFWDVSASKASYKADAGQPDFHIGTAVGDAAAADTTMKVALNEVGRYRMSLERGGDWTTEATNGLGVTLLPGGGAKLAFSSTNEAAQAALYSNDSVPIAGLPIFECRFAIFDIGNAAALDIDVGLASGSHATDFETVAYFAVVHLDGSALDIKVMSDDNTTDVAAVDSTIDAVDDTYFEVWIDCRNPADVQIYVNGVDAVPSGTTLVLTGATTNGLKALVMIEKTTSTTTADVRCAKMRVRTSGE